jgi:hypothetical protein
MSILSYFYVQKIFYICCAVKLCLWNYAEAFIEKAEKKSWHPIVWPHPEQCAPEVIQSQKVWWNFFIALFCKINWFMMVNDFDKIVFYGPHSLWFPSFVEILLWRFMWYFFEFWNWSIVLLNSRWWKISVWGFVMGLSGLMGSILNEFWWILNKFDFNYLKNLWFQISHRGRP